MVRQFTLSNAGVRAGRFHTLLTSMFSHIELNHLAFNMVTLYFFAMTGLQVRRATPPLPPPPARWPGLTRGRVLTCRC